MLNVKFLHKVIFQKHFLFICNVALQIYKVVFFVQKCNFFTLWGNSLFVIIKKVFTNAVNQNLTNVETPPF